MTGSRSKGRQLSVAAEANSIRRDGHRIAFAVAGARQGIPVAVLHGGPGSGSQRGVLGVFDLARFMVVLIDQRGAGASRPGASLRQNRTDRLVADMEAIRHHLGIARWGLVGGSWGAALALAYAGTYPERVAGVVMRGLFFTSGAEVRRLFVGSRTRAPRAWARLVVAAGCDRPSRLLTLCARALTKRGASPRRAARVALAWRAYEDAVLASAHVRRAPRRAPAVRSRVVERKVVAKYRIQAHYLLHRCWLGEHRLLFWARRAARAGVPLAAVHGQRDPVCPAANLARLARAVPSLDSTLVKRAGHLGSEPDIAAALADAVRRTFTV